MQKNENFGARLRALRKYKGLSQADLGEKLGYNQGVSISNIESDKTRPEISALQKIAEALDADLHWLITGKRIEALKVLQPVAVSYLIEQNGKIYDLKKEQAELEIRESMGETHTGRLEQIERNIKMLEMDIGGVEQFFPGGQIA